MYATLGDVRFQFLNSFNNLETTHKADYAEHAVLKGRPRLQATGKGLMPHTVIHAALFAIR